MISPPPAEPFKRRDSLMYEIRYLSDGYKEIYATKEEWDKRIDYIAEVSSYDIDI